jgi:hypothetical protein
MLSMGSEHKVEKYPEYRNRVFTRHKRDANNMVIQIRQCSLRDADKKKLLAELVEILTYQNPATGMSGK